MSDNLVIVSLPYDRAAEQTPSAQFAHLGRSMGNLSGALRQMFIPALKVGTLDSLMEASDELAKLDPQLEATVMKLVAIMEEASQKPRVVVTTLRINQNDEMGPDKFLKGFSWNAAQFDTKESIRVLIEKLGQVASAAEERVRTVLTEFTESRQKLQAVGRKNQGNLAIRPIRSEVEQKMRSAPLDTEFLITLFVAVPISSQKDWDENYWKFSDNSFVCPRSSTVVSQDKEFVLNSVVLFKRAVDEFKNQCRKRKFVVRDLVSGGEDDISPDQLKLLTAKVEKDRTTLMGLLAQQYSLCYTAWIHVKVVRVFVESMLKYGLPPRFVATLLAVDQKKEDEIRKKLNQLYPELAELKEDGHHDTGALQHEYGYVSLKITNVQKVNS
jgi:V-type H+-transporting ATPase subunit C